MEESQKPAATAKRYLWPWAVAVMLVLGIVLAVVWLRREVQRVQQQRQYQIPREAR